MASYVITKDVAKNAAKELVKKKWERVEKELTQREYECGAKLAHKYYPKEVLDFVAEYSNYVGCMNSFYVRCEGLPARRIDTAIKLPGVLNYITVGCDEYNEVAKIRNAWDKITKEKQRVKEGLVDEILKLRTYNRVKEQVPELLPLLPAPKEEKQLPAVEFGNFRAYIKNIIK